MDTATEPARSNLLKLLDWAKWRYLLDNHCSHSNNSTRDRNNQFLSDKSKLEAAAKTGFFIDTQGTKIPIPGPVRSALKCQVHGL